MMHFGLRYLSKKLTVIHISTYFTDKLDKCFSVWCLIGFAPVYLSVSYAALSCLSHLNSSSTISSRRTIRSRVSLVDNNTILDLNNLPPSQMSCWIMMSCIINPAPTKPINNTLQTQCKCIHDADRRVFLINVASSTTLCHFSQTHTHNVCWPYSDLSARLSCRSSESRWSHRSRGSAVAAATRTSLLSRLALGEEERTHYYT